jgi:hypothetical protein
MNTNVDVLVVGGGPAGVAAAIAAARDGVKTALVERYGFLGGAATAGLVVPMGTAFVGDVQVVKGIFQEIVSRLVRMQGSWGHQKTVGTTRGWGGYMTMFAPPILRIIEEEMVQDVGVRLLYHSIILDVTTSGNRVTEVTVGGKGGTYKFRPKVVIDATGDGDLAYLAGCSYQKGRLKDGRTQPVTLMVRLGGVSTTAIKEFIVDNPKDFAWHAFLMLDKSVSNTFENEPVVGSGFRTLVKEEFQEGNLYFGRERFLFCSGMYKGEMYLNATRVNDVDGTDSAGLTFGEMEARKQAFSLFKVLKRRAPGFADSFFIETASQIGVRQTRQIKGHYLLTEEDVLMGKKFEDGIACGSFPIDIHEVDSEWGRQKKKESRWTELSRPYDIPYRSLVASDVCNLLVAGRCVSATHEAMGSLRTQPTVMAIGEAAGAAAAIAVQENSNQLIDLDIRRLRTRLKTHGVYLR